MYCDHCGIPVADNETFCHSCGKQLAPVPAASAPPRAYPHEKVLGILWLVRSGLHLMSGLFVVALGRTHLFGLGAHVPEFVMPLVMGVGGLLMAASVAGVVLGWGFLEQQSWARPLGIVLGALALLHPPFGTALGVYTLWFILSAAPRNEFRRDSRAA